MTNKKLRWFYERLNSGQVSDAMQLDYLNKLLENLKQANKTNDKFSFYLILIIILFYSLKNSFIDVTQIQFVTIKKIETIKIVLPAIYCYVIIQYSFINNYRSELIKLTSGLIMRLYKLPPTDTNADNIRINPFVHSIMPYSFWNHLNKFNKRGYSVFNGLISMPILIVILVFPIFFLGDSIVFLLKSWSSSLLTKGVTCFVGWTCIYLFYFYIKQIKLAISDEKEKNQNIKKELLEVTQKN